MVAFVVLVVGLLLMTPAAAAVESKFVLSMPEGWTDVSPGQPATALDGLSPEVRPAVEASRSNPETLRVAVDPTTNAMMYAIHRAPGDSEPLDEDSLLRAASALGWRGYFVVEERRLETVSGLSWGRFTGHTDSGRKFVTYLVPGRPRSLFVMFHATPDVFDSLVPVFERAARATTGAQLPPERSGPAPTLLLMIIAAGAVLMVFRARATKRKRAAASSRS